MAQLGTSPRASSLLIYMNKHWHAKQPVHATLSITQGIALVQRSTWLLIPPQALLMLGEQC